MLEFEKVRVVVLNDGETYTDLNGCTVLTIEVPMGDHETAKDFRHDLDDAVKAGSYLSRPGETFALENGVRVTLDDHLDERLGNDA